MKFILSAVILMFSLDVSALECTGHYSMKDGNINFSTYPTPCDEAMDGLKNGFFCQTPRTFFDVKQRHNRVLPNSNGYPSCDYILEYLLVGDKYCPYRYDSYSLTTGYITSTRPERCEDAIRK